MHSSPPEKKIKQDRDSCVSARGDGGRPSLRLSKALSFLHSLTRSSREHLRSGKDRKTTGFMITLGSTAGTGVGCWEWVGLDWVRKGLGSGSQRQSRILPAATPRPLDPELQQRTPGTTSREASQPSLPGPAHLGAHWEM